MFATRRIYKRKNTGVKTVIDTAIVYPLIQNSVVVMTIFEINDGRYGRDFTIMPGEVNEAVNEFIKREFE
jgi:hypothetical protein